MISLVENSLRCVTWPRMWSVLVNVPCELEKNIILPLLDKVVYRYQLDLDEWLVSSAMF